MSKSGISSFKALIALLCLCSAASAQLLLGAGDGRKPSGGAASTTAWNPSDKTANNTLSTVTVTNDLSTGPGLLNAYTAARSTVGYSTEKVFAEFAPTSLGDFVAWGFCNATSNLSAATCGNQDANGVTLDGAGFLRHNSGAALANLGALTGMTKLQFAYDTGANKIWGRWYNGSVWSDYNGDPSADPATATGGVTPTVTGPVFLYISSFADTAPNNVAQLKCSSFSTAIPSGFSAC